MLTAISRYGARVVPDTQQRLAALARDGQMVDGPHIAAFERAFAGYVGAPHARATSYGRTAFLHLLRALELPPGSEIVFPALTFWVVPELARVAGFRPVFADVDPETFTLDPASVRRVLSADTRAIVPTHLWGLPCDMDALGEIAAAHRLIVIEDCAHALGARYRGRAVGTIGDAAFFSFQTLKPLNTYGGGMAVTGDAAVDARLAAALAALPRPPIERVRGRLFRGRVQRIAIRPRVFTATLFPMLWAASWGAARPDVYLWEQIRPLDPLPEDYLEGYSNAQAALGLAGLERLPAWTAASRDHAAHLDADLAAHAGVSVPARPPGREHAFYQYCLYAADRDEVVRRAIRRGVDLESLHVDVCTALPLFAGCRRDRTPGADRAAEAVQVPVYASLTGTERERITRVLRRITEPAPRRALGASA